MNGDQPGKISVADLAVAIVDELGSTPPAAALHRGVLMLELLRY